MRTEADAYGNVSIPEGAYWGPQTERSRVLFAIGTEQLNVDVIRCFGAQKSAAARANLAVGILPETLANAIDRAAVEMRDGRFDDQFPIVVWQTGSGTQTNMNANEVIANRANELLGQPLGSGGPIHPNDHVNLGQSSNDTFPTVMHVCTIRAVGRLLAPSTDILCESLTRRAGDFHDYVKLGMTHLQDALPVTLGLEFRTWKHQLATSWSGIERHVGTLRELPQGGTASGSGVNAHPSFSRRVAEELSAFAGQPLTASDLPSALMASHDGFAALCGALNVHATILLKICNDIRLLTSSLGGTASMGLPDEGLSSSIMPSKRNATVCEAVIQVCLRVIGNSATVVAANASSTLQLNTCKPLILTEVLNSIHLLADAQNVLAAGCIEGLTADRDRLLRSMERSAVLVSVLAPIVGYDAAARLTQRAATTGQTVREIILNDRLMEPDAYDGHLARILDPDRLDPGGKPGTAGGSTGVATKRG